MLSTIVIALTLRISYHVCSKQQKTEFLFQHPCLYGQLKDADLRRDKEMNGHNIVPNKWFAGFVLIESNRHKITVSILCFRLAHIQMF